MTLIALPIDVWPTGTTSTSHKLTGGCGETQDTRQPIRDRNACKQLMSQAEEQMHPWEVSPVLPWLPQRCKSYRGLYSPPLQRAREQSLLVHGIPESELGVKSKLLNSRFIMGQRSLQIIYEVCACWTYQVVITSSSCYYIRNSALAFLNKGHKLEDDPRVLLHLIDKAQIDHNL